MSAPVAVLGLGHMGLPMARTLVAAGSPVRVWSRTPRPGAVPGASEARSVAEALDGAGFVVTMLSDDVAVEAVTLGPGGVLEHLAPEAVHLGCSTVSVALSQLLAEAHAAGGRWYVAAPVLGRPEVAATGSLRILAGGSAETIDACLPLLETLGSDVWRFASAEQASLAKLINNFVLATMLEAMGESFALAERAGIDPELLIEMLTSGPAGSRATGVYAPLIGRTAFSPAAFSLTLGRKDVDLARQAAEAHRVSLPLADLVLARMTDAINRGRGDLDWSGMATVTREAAGLPALRAERS